MKIPILMVLMLVLVSGCETCSTERMEIIEVGETFVKVIHPKTEEVISMCGCPMEEKMYNKGEFVTVKTTKETFEASSSYSLNYNISSSECGGSFRFSCE